MFPFSLIWHSYVSRGIIISYEDGTIRILSLSEAANNVPVTGKPFVGTLQEGLHRYCCSSYTIWSIQVSRITGKFLKKHLIYILFSRV